jgi:hypothetical protein
VILAPAMGLPLLSFIFPEITDCPYAVDEKQNRRKPEKINILTIANLR